jgi:hypothetical protein
MIRAQTSNVWLFVKLSWYPGVLWTISGNIHGKKVFNLMT